MHALPPHTLPVECQAPKEIRTPHALHQPMHFTELGQHQQGVTVPGPMMLGQDHSRRAAVQNWHACWPPVPLNTLIVSWPCSICAALNPNTNRACRWPSQAAMQHTRPLQACKEALSAYLCRVGMGPATTPLPCKSSQKPK
jgi:hypothetical protein